MAHSKKRRSSLFSLSARMQRRAATPKPSPKLHHVIINADGSQDEDDNCPICIAAREGKPIPLDAMESFETVDSEELRLALAMLSQRLAGKTR